jgi:hypothetical protein
MSQQESIFGFGQGQGLSLVMGYAFKEISIAVVCKVIEDLQRYPCGSSPTGGVVENTGTLGLAAAVGDAKQVRGNDQLLLNPPRNPATATRRARRNPARARGLMRNPAQIFSLVKSATSFASRLAVPPATNAAPVEHPAVQIAPHPEKKRGEGRAGIPIAKTRKLLNLYIKFRMEGNTDAGAVELVTMDVRFRYRKTTARAIKAAVKKYLNGGHARDWASVKF